MNIKELAKKCGVSTATVSRAFDENAVIKDETRKRILELAREYNYSPDLIARSLKRRKTNTVGFVIPSVDNYFYINVLKYLEIELKKHDFRMLISFTQNEVQTEEEAIDIMLASHVDALIIVPQGTVPDEKIWGISRDTYILQLFGKRYDFLDSVYMDDRQGVKIALKHLISQGHRRIMYLSACPDYENYIESFSESGFVADTRYILPEGCTESEIAASITSLQPTAILGIALYAEKAWKASVNLCGLSISDDISFIAYDDLNWVDMMNITAISHDYQKIASSAAGLIIDNLTQRRPVSSVVLMPYLVKRKSVAKIN